MSDGLGCTVQIAGGRYDRDFIDAELVYDVHSTQAVNVDRRCTVDVNYLILAVESISASLVVVLEEAVESST